LPSGKNLALITIVVLLLKFTVFLKRGILVISDGKNTLNSVSLHFYLLTNKSELLTMFFCDK